jgi:hypothetical protein
MSSKPGFWRKCRIAFRCARFTVWGAVFLLIGAFAWLNLIGLPDFLKTRLVTALQQRGVQLEFTRMRLRIAHGLICDNVRLGAAEGGNGPVLTASEVQLRVNFPALLHWRLQVDGLVLRQGKFVLPVAANDSLTLTNVQGELRILPDETWSLDQLRAGLSGATVALGGEIAHAPEFRNWKLFATAPTPNRGSVQSSLQGISETLKQIHFEGQPLLTARLNGDARDVHSLVLRVSAQAPGVQTPWFSVSNLEFAARVVAAAHAAPKADPAWGFWTNLQPFRVDWLARGTDLRAGGLTVNALDGRGRWDAPEVTLTGLSARLGGGGLDAHAQLDVGSRELAFTANSGFDLHAVAPLLTDKTRDRLAQITWTHPPRLRADGTLTLPPWANRAAGWRDDIEPSVRLQGDLAFTNALVAGVARVDTVRTHFRYANLVWNLPDLELTQGRTTLALTGEEDEATKNFRCTLGGNLDAESVRSFLTESNAARGFAVLRFNQPVAVELDVTGSLRDLAALSATGRVVATDFAIRGQTVDRLAATLAYTNLTAEFYHPQMVRANGGEKFAAEKLTLDLAGRKLWLQGGRGRITPMAVARAIGPKTAEAFAPYQFLAVPEATVDGCIPLTFRHGDLVTDDADLQFHVIGTLPFRWRKFETPAMAGTIRWLRNDLIITNVTAACYGGTADGWGVFDVQTPGAGTDFSFFMEGTNVDLNAMGLALWSPTNQLRGGLSGQVTVTSANSADWRTWNGYGQAQVQNGLLWNAPVFGLVSPVLNTITPGLDVGNSRATEGAGRFTLVNGVIFTDSLEIRSLTMRLDYVGTVDLQQNVAARARAQLLRNTPVVGSFFSLVLSPVSKAFECEVTGTLSDPQITPVYIPFSRVLTAPLHPIRTVEKMFAAPATNAPAKP